MHEKRRSNAPMTLHDNCPGMPLPLQILTVCRWSQHYLIQRKACSGACCLMAAACYQTSIVDPTCHRCRPGAISHQFLDSSAVDGLVCTCTVEAVSDQGPRPLAPSPSEVA